MGGELPEGWSRRRLGDVINLKRGYDLPKNKRRSGAVPVVSSSGVSGTHDEAKVRAPGVVTGRYGTIGEVFFLEEDFWPLNTSLYVQAFNGSDPRYVAALLQTLNWRAHDGKSGVPGVNRNDIHEEVVVVPPLAEQVRISRVLKVLDDRIESNQRTCDLARQVLMQCLPQDGIPTPLTDVAAFVNGGALTKLANGRGRPILRIKELRAGVSQDTPCTDAGVRPDHDVNFGDLLFSWSGTLLVRRWTGAPALLNQHVFRVVPNPGFPTWLVEAWIEQHLESFRRTAADKATTMGHIQRHHLTEALVCVPPAPDLESLDARWSQLDRLRVGLLDETQMLVNVRDALLPKLVSGQLRVGAESVSAETLAARETTAGP